MGTFQIIKTGEIKQAYSIEQRDKKVFVRFTKNGKEYGYAETSIEIIENKVENTQLLVYSLERTCSKCGETTEILTYLLYDDGTDENLIFPWEKERLNRTKTLECELLHMQNPDIEYYPIKVIGADRKFDRLLMKHYPERIRKEYSGTQKRKYAMNICQCGAKQGQFFVYELINICVKNMKELKVVGEIPFRPRKKRNNPEEVDFWS